MDTQKQSPDSTNSQTYHFSLFLFLLFLFYPLCSCLLPIIEFLYLCYLLLRFQSFPRNIVPFIQFKNSIKKPGGGKKPIPSAQLSFLFLSSPFIFTIFSSLTVSLLLRFLFPPHFQYSLLFYITLLLWFPLSSLLIFPCH